MINGMDICGYIWLAFYAIWILVGFRTKRAVQQADFGNAITYYVPIILGYYLMFGFRENVLWLQHRILPRTNTLAILAIVITLAGMAFAGWARAYLGKNWSSVPQIKEHHELIRTGPYRYVRHPIYTGILVALIGTFLANGKVRGALAVVLLAIGWKIKSRLEEEFMRRTFGPEYEEYCRTTGALFPRLLG